MAVVSQIETPTTDDVRQFYERIARTSRGLGVLNVFKVMAHTPALMQSWWEMMALLFTRLELDPRLRELAVLRLFQVTRCAYGFAHHVRIGRDVGITDDEIAGLGYYADTDRFSELDKLVLQYADAVTTLDENASSLARELLGHISERALVELTFCIANWNLMAHLLEPLEVELEPAAREFLPDGWQD
ncbi:MAG: carboxymuconolactone decarboxylase family protein [Dehalococcoidia bacterium]|nr:carboxymuconolactone decarboxylase family protein [Dehalococcoidia bacterium]